MAYAQCFFYLSGIMRSLKLPYFIAFLAIISPFFSELNGQENMITDYEMFINFEEETDETPAHNEYVLRLFTTTIWGECQTDTVFQTIEGDQVYLNYVQEIGTNNPVNQCQLPYLLDVPNGDWTFNVQLSIPGFPNVIVQDSISFDYTIEESLSSGIEELDADEDWVLESQEVQYRELLDLNGKLLERYEGTFAWASIYESLPRGIFFIRAFDGIKQGSVKVFKVGK